MAPMGFPSASPSQPGFFNCQHLGLALLDLGAASDAFLLLQRALEKLEKGPTERSCHKLFSMPFFGQSTGYSFESRAKNFWSNTTDVLRPSCRFMFPHCWQVQNRWKQEQASQAAGQKIHVIVFCHQQDFFMLESLLKLIGECIWTVYLCIWTLKLICSASPFLHKFKNAWT